MPTLPLVSVVVTAYNYGRFIAECLDSLLAQDWPQDRLEIVVIDDGSTDDTADVVARYGDRVRYVRQENAGQIAATEHGMRIARGEYIALLDADDLAAPDRVRRQAEVLMENPSVGLVYSDMDIRDEHGALVDASYHRSRNVTPHRGAVLGPLLKENFMPGGTLMVRADLRPHFLPFAPEASVQDWWINVCVARVADVEYVDRPLNRYRLHGPNGFDAPPRKMAQLVANDIVFRRWMLRTFDLTGVTVAQLVEAWNAFDWGLRFASGWLERAPQDVAPTTPAELEQAAAELATGRDALAAGEPWVAAVSTVVALACAPAVDEVRTAASELLIGALRYPDACSPRLGIRPEYRPRARAATAPALTDAAATVPADVAALAAELERELGVTGVVALDVDDDAIAGDHPLAERLSGAVVVCANALERLVHPERLLAKLHAALGDAAAVVLTTPDREANRGILHLGPPPEPAHVREWTAAELADLLGASGFEHGALSMMQAGDDAPVTVVAVLVADDARLDEIERIVDRAAPAAAAAA